MRFFPFLSGTGSFKVSGWTAGFERLGLAVCGNEALLLPLSDLEALLRVSAAFAVEELAWLDSCWSLSRAVRSLALDLRETVLDNVC